MRPPAFLLDARQQSGQEGKKSLRNQSAENGTEPFGPASLYSVLVAETAYNLPCTTSAVCTWQGRVPFAGRSARQTTMYDTDTTEQKNGGDQ